MTFAELAERSPRVRLVGLGAGARRTGRGAGPARGPRARLRDGLRPVWARRRARGDGRAWLRFHLITAARPTCTTRSCRRTSTSTGARCPAPSRSASGGSGACWVVQGALGEAVGQVYVARHFPPAHKARVVALVANLHRGVPPLDHRAGVDGRADPRQGAGQARGVHPQARLPGPLEVLRRARDAPGRPGGQRPTLRGLRAGPRARQDRQADRPGRVVHDPADGQRVLQPRHERGRLPRRDPPAAVLRRRRGRRGQLRRDRRGDRPRDRSRLRRPGLEVRRRRPPRRLVDRRRPRGVRASGHVR